MKCRQSSRGARESKELFVSRMLGDTFVYSLMGFLLILSTVTPNVSAYWTPSRNLLSFEAESNLVKDLVQRAKHGLPALISRARVPMLPELEVEGANHSYTSHISSSLGTEAVKPETSANAAVVPTQNKPLDCSSSEELTTITVILNFTSTILSGTFTADVSLLSAEGGAHTSSSIGLVTQSTSVFESFPASTSVGPTATSKPTSTSDSETEISIVFIDPEIETVTSTIKTILSTLVVTQRTLPRISERDPSDNLAGLSNSPGRSVTVSQGTAAVPIDSASIATLPTPALSRGVGARMDRHNWIVGCGFALAALL